MPGCEYDLLQLAVAGHTGARARLLCAYMDTISRCVVGKVPLSEVDDVIDDAVLALLQGLSSFRVKGAFQAWVRTIAKRAVFRHYRRLRIERSVFVAACEDIRPIPPPDIEAATDRLLIEQLLSGLPVRQKEALLLRYGSGLSFAEIAGQLGVSVAAAKMCVRRATRALRADVSAPSALR